MSRKTTNYFYSTLIVYKIYSGSFKETQRLHKHPAITEVFDTSEHCEMEFDFLQIIKEWK